MPRPLCARLIRSLPRVTYYKPRGIPLSQLDEVVLTYDECEAIRLADLEGLYHEEAAAKMKISRPTFGRIIESAHRKIAAALVNGKAIKIEGGVVRMVQKRTFQCFDCGHSWQVPFGTGRPSSCPSCKSANIARTDNLRGPGRWGRGACWRRRGGPPITTSEEDK